jgi:subtilisin family serine protease
MSSQFRSDRQRSPRFESCEERLALSAQPLADLLTQVLQPQAQASQVTQSYNQQSIQAVHANYGFQGKGQTIAVIDSGIAWDHYALGGGFGSGAKVVGGWDFAENDANPYDDGGAGFHGTHVSGIIGSEDPQVRGVAPGVDLVSLRVFTDQGAGKMEWVEQALQWVHQNRNRFENPITAVNLSLGSAWNSSNVPNWATLEEEFAQLKADGIFVSVAAGNSFSQYKSAGVAYPAASSHVVPVATAQTAS